MVCNGANLVPRPLVDDAKGAIWASKENSVPFVGYIDPQVLSPSQTMVRAMSTVLFK